MTRIESDKVNIGKPASEVYTFLSDFHNIGKLMPPQVVEFTVENDSCRFTIQGMATLGLKYSSLTPHSEIIMSKHEKGPFDFNLICHIKETDSQNSELQLLFDADLNPFLQMMAVKPLGNFLNLLVKKFQEINS